MARSRETKVTQDRMVLYGYTRYNRGDYGHYKLLWGKLRAEPGRWKTGWLARRSQLPAERSRRVKTEGTVIGIVFSFSLESANPRNVF